MPNIHPLLTHFPIALLTMGLLFDVLSLTVKDEKLKGVGWWMQLWGTIGVVVSVASGLFAKSSVIIPAAGQVSMEWHEQIAFLVAVLTMLLLLWRFSSRRLVPPSMKSVYLGILAATVTLIWIGAWYGGELVYKFGVGVQYVGR